MVNHKRVRHLNHSMGLEAIYPKPKLSKRNDEHKVFPYLLRGLPVLRPDRVAHPYWGSRACSPYRASWSVLAGLQETRLQMQSEAYRRSNKALQRTLDSAGERCR